MIEPPPSPAGDLVRTMALVDENIGLRAELAELRHRVEVAGVPPTGAPSEDLDAADARVEAAEARAAVAEAALAAVLSSRSWRLAQLVAGVFRRLARRR